MDWHNKCTYCGQWTWRHNKRTSQPLRPSFLKILNSEHIARQLHLTWSLGCFFSLSLSFYFFSSFDRIIEFNGANTMEITLMYKTTINWNCEYTRLTIVKSLESQNTVDERAGASARNANHVLRALIRPLAHLFHSEVCIVFHLSGRDSAGESWCILCLNRPGSTEHKCTSKMVSIKFKSTDYGLKTI